MLAILIQLPPAFDRVPDHRLYLSHLLDALVGLPVAVEFCHRSWADERVFKGFKDRRVTLDVPDLGYLFPSLDVVTNPDLIYIRFHGRNTRGWRSGNMQKQFDYDYSPAELEHWSSSTIPKMTVTARTGAIFFNNHVRAQAPRNAQILVAQLESRGFSMKPSGQ
ncbi:hypothetical protein DSCO28_68560 [Desulfosarcina ovata subsp. sediminis]|uniref:DUF72 domain-containing protein n=1 Tax=Desulfosarcina ovata subsp. sediminis TaxID=885957 RepID=A0A5K8A1Z8_9BACT|nr:DUF72 domain-containing protein [Desulfosarcina ovata]BBO86290.1 hypothetical protein DSCO28_68560 [Desulfosarcina ovata subsp. sediminis]